MTAKDAEIIQEALDKLGVALADHNHTWTNEQRRLYEEASKILQEKCRCRNF